MNLKITAAVAATLACSAPAFASNLATTISPQVKLVTSGASAARDSFLVLMANSACQAGTFDMYRIAPTANQDFRAYSCTIVNDAASFGSAANKTATVYYRSEGGAAWGPVPIATNTQVTRLAVDLNCTTTSTASIAGVAGTFVVHDCVAPAGDFVLVGTNSTDADKSATNNAHFAKDVVQLGVSDEEPKMFGPPNFPSSHVFDTFAGNKQGVLNTLNGSAQVGFGQVFGVVVNTNTGAPGNGVSTPVNSPFIGLTGAQISLGKSTLAGIFNGTYRNWADVPTSTGGRVSASSLTIRICRREPGSGTQVAANQYFLGTVQCQPSPIGGFRTDGADADDAATAFFQDTDGVIERGATGDLLNCVQGLAGGIGFATYTTSPPAGTAFIGIDGQTPDRNKAAAGQYGFVFEQTFQINATGDAAALAQGLVTSSQISTSAPNTASVVSLPNENNDFFGQGPFVTTSPPIAYGTRGGNSCSPIAPVTP